MIFGQEVGRIPCVSFISLPRINSKKLQFFLNKNFIHLSTGSACSDKRSKLSNTVLSLGFNDEIAINTIRISIDNNEAEKSYKRIYDCFKIFYLWSLFKVPGIKNSP